MKSPDLIVKQIEQSFKKLKFNPRGDQSTIVFNVLNAFLNEDKRNVVLGCPTGGGKSIIGAVVADAMDAMTQETDLAAIMLTSTNILGKQYADTFETMEKYQVFQIKGASNYPCKYMEAQINPESKTAEECVIKNLHPIDEGKYCKNCEFDAAKKIINSTEILVTNYSYFLISMMATHHLKERKMHVFDEAHLLNDIFCNYTEILVSVENLDKFIKELADTNGKCDNEAAALVMLKNRIAKGEIGEGNYMQILGILEQVYISIGSVLANQAAGLVKVDLVQSNKYEKLSKKYFSNAGKIKDLFDNEYDHVFDDSVANTFSVKTIFVGKMMDKLLAKYNLFMSATITEQFVFDTLDLDKSSTKFIELDPVFPKENKPILFIGKQALNYHSLKLADTISELKAQIKAIVEFHGEDKGLIMVPSFFLGSQLASSVTSKTRVFEHKSGMNFPEMVDEFKSYKGSSILISPSIFEGLDFKDDASRFQVIVKSPYPSLGDKRIKHIADHYPNVYQEMTLIKILQGIGRSIRTPTDYGVTYMLDKSSQKLYNSDLNIWKSHYDVKVN